MMASINSDGNSKNLSSSVKNNKINISQKSYIDNYLHNILTNHDHNLSEIYTCFLDSLIGCRSYKLDEILKTNFNNLNQINMLNLNCRSLFNKLDEIEVFISSTKIDFDVIIFTETWLKPHNEKITNLNNYNSITLSRKQKIGGGIAFFINKNIAYIHRNELTKDNINIEIELDIIEIIKIKSNIIIINIYRPPNTQLEIFFNVISQLLDKITKENKIIYLIGDFNINLYSHNPIAKNLLDLLLSYSLLPTINIPTRFSNNTITTIDNIFTNNLNDFTSGTIIYNISDHFPNFISQTIAKKTSKKNYELIYFQNFSKKKLKRLTNALYLYNWETIKMIEDGNESFEYFLLILKQYINHYCPLTSKKIKKFKPSSPWISSDLIKIIRNKNKLFENLKKDYTNDLSIKFKNLRSSINNTIKFHKKKYFENIFKKNIHNNKITWHTIKQLINKNQPSKIHIINQNNEIIQEPKSIANAFNEYFINLFKSSSLIDNNHKKFLNLSNTASISFEPTNANEIINLTNQLSNSSTLDIHFISNKILKIIIYPISNILSYLFNKFISAGIIPDSLKISKVSPIHKNGSTHEISNYRPISIISCFSKLLEKIIKIRFENFFTKHQILTNAQFGFRTGLSTENAVLKFVNQTVNNINNNFYTLTIFIDFSKAFDCINHNILLSKLNHYGIRGHILKLIQSYLTNRFQCVTINNSNSNLALITSGIPQGSVLGPLLFNIFINDIVNATKISNFIIYADDVTLSTVSSDITDLIRKSNLSLSLLDSWSRINQIFINSKKTKFMLFTNKKKIPLDNITIQFNNQNIEKVQVFKLLGVYIDNKLNFKFHVDHILSKININLAIIYKIKPFLNSNTCKILYYSLFYSHFYYCNLVWGAANKTTINVLYTAQKKVLKLLFLKNSYNPPLTLNIFNENKILTIFEINIFKSCLYIHKILNNNLNFKDDSVLPESSFAVFNDIHTTRSVDECKCLIKISISKNKLSDRNFYFYGPINWNNLPFYLRILKNYKHFKLLLKEYLLCFS